MHFFNSIIIAQNDVLFYFIILYGYWGNFQSSYETKKSSMEKIMRLILEELKIMRLIHPWRISYVRQTLVRWKIVFIWQLFLKNERISLNWSWIALIVAYIHCDTTLITMSLLKHTSIRHKIKTNHAAWLSIDFPFDLNFLFLTEDTEE